MSFSVCFGTFETNLFVLVVLIYIFGLFWLILKQICLFWLFQYTFSVWFGSFWNKTFCFSCFEIHWKQTETNQNKIFIGFENEPKQMQNRSCLGYFRFEPNFFVFFVSWTPYSQVIKTIGNVCINWWTLVYIILWNYFLHVSFLLSFFLINEVARVLDACVRSTLLSMNPS